MRRNCASSWRSLGPAAAASEQPEALRPSTLEADDARRGIERVRAAPTTCSCPGGCPGPGRRWSGCGSSTWRTCRWWTSGSPFGPSSSTCWASNRRPNRRSRPARPKPTWPASVVIATRRPFPSVAAHADRGETGGEVRRRRRHQDDLRAPHVPGVVVDEQRAAHEEHALPGGSSRPTERCVVAGIGGDGLAEELVRAVVVQVVDRLVSPPAAGRRTVRRRLPSLPGRCPQSGRAR